jgi:hypothetical protein
MSLKESALVIVRQTNDPDIYPAVILSLLETMVANNKALLGLE